jgi:hypothetical protein
VSLEKLPNVGVVEIGVIAPRDLSRVLVGADHQIFFTPLHNSRIRY